MKKGFWISIGLLLLCNTVFATSETMQFNAQPAGTVSSLPASFTISNLAPVPQNLCGATVSGNGESATCSGLPVCKDRSAQTASFTCSVTTTCGSTVSSKQDGGQCTVSLNVVKPSTLAASTAFSFGVSHGSYNALLLSNAFTLNGTNPLPPADGYRTITFKNSCDAPVWFGTITGAAPTKTILTGGSIDCTGGDPGKQACVSAGGACYARVNNPDACFSQACSSDSQCATGASCYAATGKCFWNNPSPSNNNFQLAHNGTNTVQIPEYASNQIGVVWSGAFGGRTGCTSGGCVSALCTSGGANAEGVCSLGVGFQQPATQAEPTFITYPTGTTPTTPSDAYDVTVINGANIPMSMYPTATALPTSGNPFTCGAPGYYQDVVGTPAGSTIGASSWDVSGNQDNFAYRYVVPTTASPTRCAADTDCTSSEYCGLSYASIGSTVAPGSGNLVCGTFAGWFTADQVCGTNNNFTNALNKNNVSEKNFRCNADIALDSKMSNLYQCNGNYAVSCYSSSSANCCGCINWGSQVVSSPFTTLPVPTNTSYVAPCDGSNTNWTGGFAPTPADPQVYDTIYFLKKSCPSCYVYPFDDKSSSFTCTDGSTTTDNTKDYTVEFCPGGNGNTNFQPPAH